MDFRERIAAELGASPTSTLFEWASNNARTIGPCSIPWQRRGFTPARLVPVFVSGCDAEAQLVVVKHLPPDQVSEFQAHQRAIVEAPPAFGAHLVRQVFEPVLVPGGGLLTFQGLAGNSRDWRPLRDVPVGQLPAACAAVTTSLIRDWNQRHTRITTVTAAEFLRGELRDNTSLRPAALGDYGQKDASLPDPLYLCCDESPFGRLSVDLICGRVHRDLHDRNVLLWQRDGQIELDSFVLVDLMTYGASQPLGCDPVVLLLSVLTRLWVDLSAPQRQLLLTAVVRPDRPVSNELPGVVADTITSVYGSAARLLAGCGIETWRWQYLLTIVGQGIVMSTYETFAPELRHWIYQLAGYAARELLTDRDLTIEDELIIDRALSLIVGTDGHRSLSDG
jgi:hypothetical protein